VPHGLVASHQHRVSAPICAAGNVLPIDSQHVGIAPGDSKSGTKWHGSMAYPRICRSAYLVPVETPALDGGRRLLHRSVVVQQAGMRRGRWACSPRSAEFLGFRWSPEANRGSRDDARAQRELASFVPGVR
jgi:hypothetical protein